MKQPFTWLASMLLFTGLIHAQSIDIQVELMNQIGTDTSRKGDLISGRVIAPPQLQGDVMEGRITESQSGAKLGGKSVFSFTFDTLRHAGSTIPITSQFKSAINSQGKQNVDEEGRIVRRGTGNVAKVAGGTGLGAVIGGIAGGGKGAAIGSAVGAGASIAMVQIAADAPNIRFAPGSRLLVEAKARSGAPLSSLAAAQPAPAQPAAQPVATASATAPASQPAPVAASQQAAADAPAQPEFKSITPAFVPGEKTIFYDDFTDMAAGDAPPHFKVRGAAPDLQAAGDVRQLLVTRNGSLFPNVTALPKNFTYEADLKFDGGKRAIVSLLLSSNNKEVFHFVTYTDAVQMDLVASLRAPFQELGRKRIPMNYSNPVRFALWVQNGRLRVYVNGEKHLDFNQVELPEINKIEFANSCAAAGQTIGYRMVRFAESAPDFSQMINASGRYVTHGILFDTGSDRMKPESAPVIQAVAKGLETNPNLKLRIEGHTDSVGNASQNLDLSRRRAEAVKSVLTAQFGIDAARLTTGGLGSTKPLESNDTPQGRSQNRRVEFVRQ